MYIVFRISFAFSRATLKLDLVVSKSFGFIALSVCSSLVRRTLSACLDCIFRYFSFSCARRPTRDAPCYRDARVTLVRTYGSTRRLLFFFDEA